MRRVIRAERPPVSSGLTPEQALDNLQAGLDFFFAETSPAEIAAQVAADRHRVRALRRAIADRIEADIAILDALAPDPDLEDTEPDLEDGADDEPSLGSLNQMTSNAGIEGAYSRCHLDPNDQRGWAEGSADDRESGDDNGIVDAAGAWEQGHADHDPFAYGFSGWHGRLFGGAR